MKPQVKEKYTRTLEIVQGIIGLIFIIIIVLIIKNL